MLIIVNSHGGQPQVINIIARGLRVRHGMFVVNAMWSRMTRKDDLFSKSEPTHGIHGGEVGTSVMLHLHEGKVDMTQAFDFEPIPMEIERGATISQASA